MKENTHASPAAAFLEKRRCLVFTVSVSVTLSTQLISQQPVLAQCVCAGDSPHYGNDQYFLCDSLTLR